MLKYKKIDENDNSSFNICSVRQQYFAQMESSIFDAVEMKNYQFTSWRRHLSQKLILCRSFVLEFAILDSQNSSSEPTARYLHSLNFEKERKMRLQKDLKPTKFCYFN